MRLAVWATISILCTICTNKCFADEFGARFYAQAPKGLGDYTAPAVVVENIAMDQKKAEELQAIVPAAGEAQEEGESTVEFIQSKTPE